MVEVDALSALDLLLWLGRGAEVSARLQMNQSTVSRKAAAASKAFDLKLKRTSEGWDLLGDLELVRLERLVHQVWRLKQIQGLRLDADAWLGQSLLNGDQSPGLITGCYHHLNHHQPLRLLRERVLDGWLTILGKECLNGDYADLTIMELGELPLELLVDHAHPLTQQSGLELNDLLRFPRLNQASGVVPWFEAEVRNRGLWDSPVTARYYSPDDWEGRTATNAAILYGHSLTRTLHPSLVPLNFALGLRVPISLVVHRQNAEQAAVQQLKNWLAVQLAQHAAQHPELQLAAD